MRTGALLPAVLLVLAASAGVARAATATATRQLLPVPAEVRWGDSGLPVQASFTVAVDGHRDERLLRGLDRALRRLEGRTGLEFARGLGAASSAATLVVRCHRPGLAVPALEEDESYALDVTPQQARLQAATVVGALRGLETLLQLLEGGPSGWVLRAASIRDRPRFPWRGLLIDVCRHWLPMDVLKRNLDGMAAAKLNVLHWHLTEDQGFRIESKRHPKLHQMGSDGLYYTQDQVREVIAYARERGIRVVPEFDVPGHATSWLVGHPELATLPGPYAIERRWGIFDPALDPTKEEVYRFLDSFLGEMAALFPDAYLHIGGDEVSGKHWDQSERVQAFKRTHGLADNHALQAYFNTRVQAIVARHGKTMVGWDEVLHPDLPKDVVVQSWRGPKSLSDAARQGYRGLLSAGYYLDLISPAADHYAADPLQPGAGDDERSRVLGGEACMWSEFVSPETVDSRIWPRLLAIAERLWSPATVRDVDDMYRRLDANAVRLEELGLTHEKNYGMMLRRLAGERDVAALRTLADAVEPVKVYARGAQRPYTQMTPLTRLVDAARPDSRVARAVARAVTALLDDAPRFSAGRDELLALFAGWQEASAALVPVIARSPVLQEAEPLARDLGVLAEIGREATTHVVAGPAQDASWRDEKLASLQQAAAPRAQLEFPPPLLAALRELVVAAAQRARLDATSPADWAREVREQAAAAGRLRE